MKTLVEDTFGDMSTETLLRGTSVTPLEKKRIFEVLKHLSDESGTVTKISSTLKTMSVNNDFDNLVKKTTSYEELMKSIEGCNSNECLMCNAILTYHISPKSLLMNTIAIHSRVMPLKNEHEWFDNFTLNSFLLQLTTITYSGFDSDEDEICYSISPGKGEVNHAKVLTNPEALLFHLGNEYRCFFDRKELSGLSPTEQLDVLNTKYPYHTGCTHGCDVFWMDNKSVSIQDIKEYCQRYPLSTVGYILNTKTYRSGRGQHWMAVMFRHNKCYLICSEGSDFSSFENASELVPELSRCGFGLVHNLKTIQRDDSSCGMFSVLANLVFILETQKGADITRVVNRIGVSANDINKNGINAIKGKLTGFGKDKRN